MIVKYCSRNVNTGNNKLEGNSCDIIAEKQTSCNVFVMIVFYLLH